MHRCQATDRYDQVDEVTGHCFEWQLLPVIFDTQPQQPSQSFQIQVVLTKHGWIDIEHDQRAVVMPTINFYRGGGGRHD